MNRYGPYEMAVTYVCILLLLLASAGGRAERSSANLSLLRVLVRPTSRSIHRYACLYAAHMALSTLGMHHVHVAPLFLQHAGCSAA